MQRRGARVTGPYAERGKFKIYVYPGNGSRTSHTCETEEAATALKKALEGMLTTAEEVTIKMALEQYEHHLVAVKENKPRSVAQTLYRLRHVLREAEPIQAYTPERCAALYQEWTETWAVDTHRNQLSECRTFFNWCVGGGKWLKANPFGAVKGVGKRRHGKLKLRIDEARLWEDKAMELAMQGDDGAVAALMALRMGMRAEEISQRQVRDVDDKGRLLWIEWGKTAAASRILRVPANLRALLIERCKGRPPQAPLFPAQRKSKTGYHWRDWPRKNVQRICGLAGVPMVSAHAMRGLNGTLRRG